MVVCKYFLQGTCRYGNYCRYDHQVPATYNTSYNADRPPSTSVLRQPQTDFQTQPAKAPNVDLNTLAKSVAQDMLGAEKGGQWLLSCYAPFKEKPPFPGFEDWSPEELRWGHYEATAGGYLTQHKEQLQILLQEALGKVRALQNPSAEVLKILQGIYNSPSLGNIFAAEAQNIFAAPKENNIFAAAPKDNNIFASAAVAQQNMFAAAPKENNIFASAAMAQPNVFAAAALTNIFAQTAPVFNSVQLPQQNAFAPLQPPQNIFPSSQPPQNAFPAPQPQQNIFAPPSQPPHNIFTAAGPPPPPSYSSLGGNPDQHLYSKDEELSLEEKNWFLSDSFDIMSIPEKPPTYEMCFKS